jgi:hypothetical protein
MVWDGIFRGRRASISGAAALRIKALPAMGLILFTVFHIKKKGFFSRKRGYNGLHMACGGFEVLSCPPKPKLATERKSCW